MILILNWQIKTQTNILQHFYVKMILNMDEKASHAFRYIKRSMVINMFFLFILTIFLYSATRASHFPFFSFFNLWPYKGYS